MLRQVLQALVGGQPPPPAPVSLSRSPGPALRSPQRPDAGRNLRVGLRCQCPGLQALRPPLPYPSDLCPRTRPRPRPGSPTDLLRRSFRPTPPLQLEAWGGSGRRRSPGTQGASRSARRTLRGSGLGLLGVSVDPCGVGLSRRRRRECEGGRCPRQRAFTAGPPSQTTLRSVTLRPGLPARL